MDILSKMPERLKELMEERDVTMKTLSNAIGISPSAISRYLSGVRLPSYESFIKIIEFFNCSADFLIGATEEPFTERTYRAMPPFQELFRSLLSQEKITQYALHKKTNFSYDNFAKWLKGETQPYLDNLLRLARALDRSVDQLLGRIV